LTSLGLEQACIALNEDEYIAKAEALATQWNILAAMRGGLRDRFKASPLMDYQRLGQSMMASYRQLWREWCAENPVTGDDVTHVVNTPS
jgi:predicted O-linked N-acetylglucosamine transferase (SPINDLY family)